MSKRSHPRYIVALGVTLCLVAASACTSATSHPTVSSTSSVGVSVPFTPPSTPLAPGVLTSISVDTGPIFLNAAFGSIWMPAHRFTYVDRIDPQTGRVVAHIDVGQDSCSFAFPTPTRVIVSACNNGTSSVVIDPKTNQVVGSVPGYVADYAYGSAWMSDSSYQTLERVDIDSRRRVTIAKVWVGALVHSAGKMWDAEFSGQDGTWYGGIAEIDPVSNRVVRAIKVPDPGLYPSLAYAFGALWLQGGGKPYFFRIDPVTGAVKRFAIPGYRPNADGEGGTIVAGTSSLWMQVSPSAIGRFDPRTGQLTDRYPADGAAGGSWPLEAYGSLWVSNFDSNTVWRDQLKS